MSTHDNVEPILGYDYADLAEVIELPINDAPSFYQRNSGALPKSEAGLTGAHRRADLPRPDNSQRTTLGDRIRGLFNR